MEAFQGNIIVKDGKIVSMTPESGKIIIHSDDDTYEYDNFYAIPGITDSHGHISALGTQISGLSLNSAKSAEECCLIASKHDKFNGIWLTGRGWNHELWIDNEIPDKKILDNYFPENPVFLTRIDGHAVWVNSEALKIAGINKFTENPPGGIIMKDKSGNPSGILLDDAISLVKKHIPKATNIQLKNNIKTALNELIKYGITSVHDMDVHPNFINIYKELSDNNELSLRIYSYISGHKNEWLDSGVKPMHYGKFNISGIKFYSDGSLGSSSAALLEPYSNDPLTKGIFLTGDTELFNRAAIALEQGFHIAVHAIGDAANRMVVNVYRKLRQLNFANSNYVLRVEHAQHIHPDDIRIFSDFGIIASIQPVHCISDAATITENRLGGRSAYAYPWKSLIDNGIQVISGSDFPIESHNPFLGIDSLTKRIPFGSNQSWNPKEIVDVDTALTTYTSEPYKAININNAGKLDTGYLADIVIIDRNINKLKDFKDIKVNSVFVNGKLKYSTNKPPPHIS